MDIVYFVKECETNEELKYSLRSIEKNFTFDKVWFVGGCPIDLVPDGHIKVRQIQPTKWDKTYNLLKVICNNKDVSDDFYLFNDDFFIMKPWKYQTRYCGELYKFIVDVEGRNKGISGYSQRLRDQLKLLEQAGCTVKNYGVHTPLKVNKKKALETLKAFPGCPMFRSLYGNYNKIGGANKPDVKISSLDKMPSPDAELLSTTDKSFRVGKVGDYIRKQFPEPSRYEREVVKKNGSK